MTTTNGNGNGTARWQLWVSAIGTSVVVIAAVLQIGAMAGDIKTLKSTQTELTRRLEQSETKVAQNRTEIDVQTAKLAEVETQFRGEADARNVMHANDLRMQAILFEKTFHTRYPTDNAYYPSIAR